MSFNIQSIVIGTALAVASCSVFATAEETARKAASATDKVILKTEKGVKRGLKKATRGVERGGAATSRAVSKTAKKLGLPEAPASASASTPTGDAMGKQ